MPQSGKDADAPLADLTVAESTDPPQPSYEGESSQAAMAHSACPIASMSHTSSVNGVVDDIWTHFWGVAPSASQHFLFAFSGLQREDSVGHFIQQERPTAVMMVLDIELAPVHDLACDTHWNMLVTLIRRKCFAASLWSPPCSTFSVARKHGDGGPPPLRGIGVPDIYGLPGLTQVQLSQVKLGTLLAVRTAEALLIQLELMIPFVFETTGFREGMPHLTLLPEWLPIVNHPKVELFNFDQCTAGAKGIKSTLLVLFLIERDRIPTHIQLGKCNHATRWWTVPWSGRAYQAPHPTIRGKQWAIPSEDWRPSMRQWSEPHGPYITREMAAYPSDMNRVLACWMVHSTASPTTSHHGTVAITPRVTQDAWVKVGAWGNVLIKESNVREPPTSNAPANTAAGNVAADLLKPQVHKRPKLRHHDEPATRAPTVGGMRRTALSVAKVDQRAVLVGRKLYLAFFEWLARSKQDRELALSNVGLDVKHVQPSLAAKGREILCRVLQPCNVDPSPLSEIYAGILGAWRKASHDPDDLPEVWLQEGAPSGVTHDIPDRGIFEPYDEAMDVRTVDPADLATENEFVNYAGVEEDELVLEELTRLTEAHWLHKFDNTEAAAEYLGAEPVLSKIGVITKMRLGKACRRQVIDAKRSSVYAASRTFQRVFLPRATDVVIDVLEMLWASWDGPVEDFEFFILDFADAFFHVPLGHKDQILCDLISRLHLCPLENRSGLQRRTSHLGTPGGTLVQARPGDVPARSCKAQCVR